MKAIFGRLVVFLSFSCFVQAAPSKLKLADVPPMYNEMLDLHVEFKEFTPTLAARSIKIFIDQFDPYRLYLLSDEVAPYLHMKESDLQKVVSQFRSGDFSVYANLSQLFQKAILRSRELRAQIAKQISFSAKDEERILAHEDGFSFASSLGELRDRLHKQLLAVLRYEVKSMGKGQWSPEKTKKFFVLWDKKLVRMENSYFSKDVQSKEHNLALHILKSSAKSLDAHTTFFSPEEAYQMRASLEKQFEGVGIVLKESVDGIAISSVVRGGPADKSGKILPGDVLVQINGKSVDSLTYEEVLDALKGERGSKVILGVAHEATASASVLQVELTREKIVMQDDRLKYIVEPCDDGVIGKIVLPSFYESGVNSSCEKDMREALRGLKKHGELKGIVIDLRDNSGGFLSQAVKLSGLFITSGVVVISKYSRGQIQYLRDVDGRSYFDGPIVLLTSKASASAAEIVAQALQDYGVAVVVGDERTYGKGTIQFQTVTDDMADNFFKVTVGRYYTVSGRSTQIEGVQADIVVPTEYHPYNIGERYLAYPLKNDQVSPAYADPLVDVDSKNKAWFMKNYIPNIQKKLSVWTQMLPDLRGNSQMRISNNRNFAKYFDLAGSSASSLDKVQLSEEIKDPQMDEAVLILKDMIRLKSPS